ncbi:MAG: queuine tRNA-ribosyltransferase, queuine tRNA-ribosyltransferase [Candidatus Peregrinibacteria bacterium GW2011_GWF2_33_10]|nr:MAG: queuine tRNA-ribosyltransferase, queuine tRNA-ribosyltransferase [Candidatus Peregrinibacteria bacterium GW2011_GWF2_33_10]OGJ44893.1 MAG: tRNA guanosine(34) transglycosylase Tgt [Candidatus Peregrinibacteria bacterium RIFOXYA2_FULL_33_21]OGJ45283.1 MAG: tRNA guanosine(34) transglycosylase Tgt [Candidatus Peregrinibacteria bacterium RIFOXYA12_FULL_33_12]OGJ50652.1 MAG: tRNA guanosine(34) transglycosylase Tgt [Candidatus Peregrinibacteria bacterium RIFOXYB2_FULL_33_20]
MFDFQIIANEKNARAGLIKTSSGEIKTPVFMPCGTKATVKSLDPDDLKSLNVQVLLGNTYHLHLRPGEKLIKKMGGLHKWMNWNKPILTDSGGFQVFSLGQGQDRALVLKAPKITKEGVEFYSHIDGSSHFLTPEKAIEIQSDLGSDIMMAFDECAPGDSSKSYAKSAMKRTHDWAKRCLTEHARLAKNNSEIGALFPIIQGVTFDDLRIESTKFISDLNTAGIAIGGLSVGEDKNTMYHVLDLIQPYLPQDKPHYLMGVGTPEDLLEGVERGIDMFDCVLPTRFARHGTCWTEYGRINVRNEKFKNLNSPIDDNCSCYACKNFSLSYIRHLFIEKEILGIRLMTLHNLHFLINLMENIRENIINCKFEKFKKSFLAKYLIIKSAD